MKKIFILITVISFTLVQIAYSQSSIRQRYFVNAIKAKDYTKVEQYIQSGVNINKNTDVNNKPCETPLMLAITMNDLRLVTILLDNRANANGYYLKTNKHWHQRGGRWGNGGYTYSYTKTFPIDVAVENYNEAIVKLLLQKGAYPNDNTVKAIKKSGSMARIKLFTEHGVRFRYNSTDLENELKRGASKSYTRNHVKFLISQGVRGNANSLILAVRKNDKQLIDLLLANGSTINNYANWCALCEAVNLGKLDMVKYLVEEKDASLNTRCNYKNIVTWSETTTSRYKNKSVTEYLLLAPSIQKRKREERLQQELEEKKVREAKALEIREEANTFFANNEFEKGIDAYQKVYALTKHQGDMDEIIKRYHDKAKELQIKKSNTEAELYFQKAYEYAIKSNDKTHLINLANFYFETEQYKKAKKIYVRNSFSKAGNERFRKIAFCKMYLGDTKSAQTEFEKLILLNKIKSKEASTHIDLARFFAYTNNKKKTLSQLKKAFKKGYKDFDFISKCNDFKSIQNSQELKVLIQKYK